MFNSSDPRKTRISNIAMLRTLVAGYLFYLGFTILRDVMKGEPGSLPVWLLWLCGILFMLTALAFGWYTWRQYRRQTAALEAESAEEEKESPLLFLMKTAALSANPCRRGCPQPSVRASSWRSARERSERRYTASCCTHCSAGSVQPEQGSRYRCWTGRGTGRTAGLPAQSGQASTGRRS